MSVSFSTPSKLLSELSPLVPEDGARNGLSTGLPALETSSDNFTSAYPLQSSVAEDLASEGAVSKDYGALLLMTDLEQTSLSDHDLKVPQELVDISEKTDADASEVAEHWVNYILAVWH